RQYVIILFTLACTIALAFVYIYTTPPQYTAHAMLLIDMPKVKVVQQQEFMLNDLPLDAAQVDTQVEVLKSEGIALSVIKAMKLTEDPEFVGRRRGFVGTILDIILEPFLSEAPASRDTASEDQLTQRALSRFLARRNVRRVAHTYILDVEFTWSSASRAATIANALADAYLTDQLQSKYQATRRASAWLQDRVLELREQAIAADRAVLEFKEKKNIIGMGGGDGRLLAEQQVIDVNSQLRQARASTAEAKARLERIQEVIKQGVPDAAVTDQLRNDIITRLRTQYLDFERRYNILVSHYGQTHLAAVSLKTQMEQLRGSMNDELSRLAESFKSDYEIAKTREGSLERTLANLVSGAQLTNRERLGLGELESRAKVYHSIHDSFLQRYMEATQQQSIPITEARVITLASPPALASNLNLIKILAFGGWLGLFLGFGGAALREAVDRVFRTSRQVETILKTNCLAAVPALKNPDVMMKAAMSNHTALDDQGAKAIKRVDPELARIFRQVVHEPLSSFA